MLLWLHKFLQNKIFISNQIYNTIQKQKLAKEKKGGVPRKIACQYRAHGHGCARPSHQQKLTSQVSHNPIRHRPRSAVGRHVRGRCWWDSWGICLKWICLEIFATPGFNFFCLGCLRCLPSNPSECLCLFLFGPLKPQLRLSSTAKQLGRRVAVFTMYSATVWKTPLACGRARDPNKEHLL